MDAVNVIRSAQIEGNKIFITEQLGRDLYNQVARLLAKYNAKWDRRAKAHVIPAEYLQEFRAAITNGFTERKQSVQQQIGFFQTSERLADELCLEGNGVLGCRVLEPNGGHGRIIQAALNRCAAEVVTVEIYPPNVDVLRDVFLGNEDVTICPGDFLEKNLDDLGGELFDVVLANPPFAKGQDVDHMMHAVQFVKKGGHISAIMGAGVQHNTTKKFRQFRDFVATQKGFIEPLPSQSFKAEGTMIETVQVYLPL